MVNTLQIRPVILCGGSVTRFWPLSRMGFSKGFLVLSGTTSLFQEAIERINGLGNDAISVSNTLIVSNEEHRFLALDQLRELNNRTAKLLLELTGINTAPILTLIALMVTHDGSDPILAVTPADEAIQNIQAFTSPLQASLWEEQSSGIVVMGIKPPSVDSTALNPF